MIPVLLALSLSLPQQGPLSSAGVRALARNQEAEAQLVTVARQQTDTLREAWSRALRLFATARSTTQRDAELEVARRLARAYAVAFSDPFLARQVTRFESAGPSQRQAKLKADSLRRAGNTALPQRGVPAAMRLWRASLQQAYQARDSAAQAATFGNLGAGFYRAGQLDSAQHYLVRSQRMATAIGDLRTAANALGILASVRRERGELPEAAELYGAASKLRERSGDSRGLAADQNNLGEIARDLGDLQGATRYFQRAYSLNESAARLQPGAVNLLNLAGVASTLGEYARSDQLYGQAYSLNRSAGAEAENAYVLYERGLLRIKRGDYSGAQVDLSTAVRMHDAAGATLDAAAARLDLASVLMASGDPQDALSVLRQAEAQAREPNVPASMRGDIARARAKLHLGVNELELASEYYDHAEKLYRSAGNDFGLAEVAEGRAFLLFDDRNYAGAHAALRAAQRARVRDRDPRGTALTQLSIAYTNLQLSDTMSARRNIDEALRTLRGLGDAVGEAVALLTLGDLALQRHTPVAADQAYLEGLQKLGTRRAADVRWRLHAGRGSALRQQRALGPAIQQLRAAVAEIERDALAFGSTERRVGFMADKLDVYAELALAQRAAGWLTDAFTTSERMRAQQTLALLTNGRVAVAHRPREREQDLRRQISELMDQLEEAAAAVGDSREAEVAAPATASAREALYRAQTAYARLLTELREQDPAYADLVRPTPASAAAIVERLRRDEVMIDYLLTDSTALAFVISRRGTALVDLGGSRQTLAPLIDFAVRVTQKHEGAARSELWRAPLARLYDYLIAPIEAAGHLKGKTALIIVPHAELHFVPFAALVNRERRSFLISRWQVSYAPSASAWSRLRDRSAQRRKGVVAIAPRVDVLPFSKAEVEHVRRVYGRQAKVLTGRAASRSALRAALPQAGIVHLATLGVLNKHNPLFSFIELGGARDRSERLEVHEVFGLRLNGQLVVLSACQTALASGALADVPAGDDWTGLVQAFLVAGAGSVVATQWAVNDRATAELMGAFHEGVRSGRRDAAALAEAQRAAIRNRKTAHPFYWAAFTLHSGG